MKVKRLHIKSFRVIDDLTLEFDLHNPTVIIGVNGEGKTSILDCLEILLCECINQIVSVFCEGGITPNKINYNDIKLNKQTAKLEAVLLFDEFQDNEIYYSVEADREVTFLEPRHNYNLTELQDFLRGQKLLYLGRLPTVIYYPINRLSSYQSHDLETSVDIINYEQFSTNAKQVYKNGIKGVEQLSYQNFFQWFRITEDLENEIRINDPNYRNKYLESVRKAICSIRPEFSDPRIRRSPLQMTILKQENNHKLEFNLNQLSEGERCLLVMVGDLARRLEILNSAGDPLQRSGIILIDEIELHLHPQWQREIIPRLQQTFPNCQFIVTTHSPQVISHVKPENIYLLESISDGVIARHPESSYGRDSNQILEDIMGTSARPQPIKNKLLELFKMIDRGDLEKAKELRQQIADEIGTNEPELVKAGVSIKRKEILWT